MTISKITVERLWNLGNYESVRLSCEVAVDSNDEAGAAVGRAKTFLDGCFAKHWESIKAGKG